MRGKKMDFKTFKENKFQNILSRFLDPDTINSYREKYEIEPTDFENDISSYEDLYKAVGYAFLFFGNAIAKTLCDIHMFENSPSPSTNMKRFQGNEKDSFVNGAWYWISNFKTREMGKFSLIPMYYSTFKDQCEFSNIYCKFSPEDSNASDIVVYGPIPVSQEDCSSAGETVLKEIVADHYAVYEPIDGNLYYYETLEEAEAGTEKAIDYYSDDGIPEEYKNRELCILKVIKRSKYSVTDSKENYENAEDWPNNNDWDEVGKVEMVDVDPTPALQRWEARSEPPDGWYFFITSWGGESVHYIDDGKVIMGSVATAEPFDWWLEKDYKVFGPIPEPERDCSCIS
jgi:hypothetical protein